MEDMENKKEYYSKKIIDLRKQADDYESWMKNNFKVITQGDVSRIGGRVKLDGTIF